MAKIEVTTQEAKALQQLMSDAQVPVPLGYILGSFMIKVEQELGKEQEKKLKDKFSKKKKKSE